MKLSILVLTLGVFIGCGNHTELSADEDCSPQHEEYTHSVLYCNNQLSTIAVVCDPSEELPQEQCSTSEDLLTDNCELVSVCCVDYECRTNY